MAYELRDVKDVRNDFKVFYGSNTVFHLDLFSCSSESAPIKGKMDVQLNRRLCRVGNNCSYKSYDMVGTA